MGVCTVRRSGPGPHERVPLGQPGAVNEHLLAYPTASGSQPAAGFDVAVVAVVFQSLVELFGMIGYLRVVPVRLRGRPEVSAR